MTRNSGKNRARLPNWMRWAQHRRPVPTNCLPEAAPPTAPIPAPAAPAAATPAPTARNTLDNWRVPIGTDVHGQVIDLDLEHEAHLYMEGELGWMVGYTINALIEHILARGAHLTLVTGTTDLAYRVAAHPRVSHYQDTQAAEAIEACYASMQTAASPARPDDHHFLLIDGLNLLRVDARRDPRAQRALDEFLHHLVLFGRSFGHHVLTYDWGLRTGTEPDLGREQLRAAFPAVLHSVDKATDFDERAVLLARTGMHELRLTRASHLPLT